MDSLICKTTGALDEQQIVSKQMRKEHKNDSIHAQIE